jgi:ribose 5-phosphate isomerase B
MKYHIASDHAGRKVKLLAEKALKELKIKYVDLSKTNKPNDDYPDFAKLVVKNILRNKNDFGILVCGTGIGMSMAANRYKGIRAALCTENKDAELARKHNNTNILVLTGWKNHKLADLKQIINTFTATKYEKGRHERRLKKIERFKF